MTRHAAQLALSFFFGLCLALQPSTARAEVYAPSDAAFQVYKQIMQEAVSTGMANMELLWDLSWRWYNADPSKRDRVPVDAVNGAEPLNHFQNWGDFYAWVKSQGYYFYYPYNLVGFDDGKYWDSSSPNADLEYAKWYDYFEGVEQPSTGGSVTDDGTWITVTNSNRIDSVMGGSTARYGNINVDGVKWYVSDISSLNNLTDFSLRLPMTMFEGMEYGYMFIQVAASGNGNGNPHVEMVLSQQIPTLNLNQDGTIASIVVSGGNARWSNGRLESVTKSVVGGTLRIDFGSVTPSTTSLMESTFYPNSGTYGSMYYLGSMENTGGGVVVPTDPVQSPKPPAPVPVPVVPPTKPTSGIVSNPVVSDLEEFQNWLDQALATYFGDVINWLKYIAEWEETISGQIYDFEENALELWQETNQWLKGIFYKRTGSGGNTGLDPVTNPDEGLTWWQKLLDWLAGLLPEGLTDLISLVSTLNRHFPFSIPWDVGLIIGMLAETPTTPEFDIRFYYPNANLDWTWHVDLAPFDTVAYIFRSAVTVWFAMVLMTWTPDVIKQTTSIV